ncbi:unnamed protein product [marine sediment metagenome]|uniref:C1q domain-containing protein n=1 Tax=marine sediment metagenome TaxID=412755 RepID=X1PXG6_9ZZZZ
MGSLKKLYGYYKTGKTWIPILVAVSGKVVISAIPDHHLSHEIDGSDEIEDLSDITPDRIKIETKCRAYLNTQQLNLVSGTWTKVLLDTENYDIGSNFTNSIFTVPITGYYLVRGQVTFKNILADREYANAIYINGVRISQGYMQSSITDDNMAQITDILHLTIDDEITLYALSVAGVNTIDIKDGTQITYMAIHLLSV